MNDGKEVKLFLVDDDAVYLKMLEIEFLRHANFIIETFSTGEECIESMSHQPDIIVLDFLLDGVNKKAMNGIDTLDKIHEIDPAVPVIILSAQDKIEVAVECMHHGALDYVVKSETAFLRMKKIITNVFQFKKMEKELNWYMERM